MIEINTYEESLALYNSDPETWEEVAHSMGHGWMYFQMFEQACNDFLGKTNV